MIMQMDIERAVDPLAMSIYQQIPGNSTRKHLAKLDVYILR